MKVNDATMSPSSSLRFKVDGLDCQNEVRVLRAAVGPLVSGDDKLSWDTGRGVAAQGACVLGHRCIPRTCAELAGVSARAGVSPRRIAVGHAKGRTHAGSRWSASDSVDTPMLLRASNRCYDEPHRRAPSCTEMRDKSRIVDVDISYQFRRGRDPCRTIAKQASRRARSPRPRCWHPSSQPLRWRRKP